jgi:hypothetical protein
MEFIFCSVFDQTVFGDLQFKIISHVCACMLCTMHDRLLQVQIQNKLIEKFLTNNN